MEINELCEQIFYHVKFIDSHISATRDKLSTTYLTHSYGRFYLFKIADLYFTIVINSPTWSSFLIYQGTPENYRDRNITTSIDVDHLTMLEKILSKRKEDCIIEYNNLIKNQKQSISEILKKEMIDLGLTIN
jgi:hypothetical protein